MNSFAIRSSLDKLGMSGKIVARLLICLLFLVSPALAEKSATEKVLDLSLLVAQNPGDPALRLELARAHEAAGSPLEALAELRRIARDAAGAPEAAAAQSRIVEFYRKEAQRMARQGDEPRARRLLDAARASGYSGDEADFLAGASSRTAALADAEARFEKDPSAATAVLSHWKEPLSARGYALRARLRLREGRSTEAWSDIERARALDPDGESTRAAFSAWRLNRARELAAQKKHADALNALEGADLARAELLHFRGRLHLSLGDSAAALADLEAAALRPDAGPSIHADLARLYSALDMMDRLEEKYPESGILPDDPVRLGRIARRRLESGDTQAATDAYRRAIQIDSGFAEGWLAMGRIRFSTGDPAAALFNLARARHLGASIDRLLLFRVLLRLRTVEAQQEMETLLRDETIDPADLEMMHEEAKRAQSAVAERIHHRLLERRGDTRSLALIKVAAFERKGDAAATLEHLLSIPDPDRAIDEKILKLALALGRESTAAEAFDRVVASGGNPSAELRLRMAERSLDRGQAGRALQLLSPLTEADRRAAPLRARGLILQGQEEEAGRALEAAGLEPDAFIRLGRARRAAAEFRHAEVIRQYDEISRAGIRMDAADYDRYILSLVAVGGSPAALEVLRRGIEQHPDALPLRLHLCRLLHERGMAEEALTHARAAARIDPENREAQRLKMELLRSLGRMEEFEEVLASMKSSPAAVDSTTLAFSIEMLAAKGRIEDAVAMLEEARARAPLAPALEETLADLYLRAGRHRSAIGILESLQATRADEKLFLKLARACRVIGDWSRAEQAFQDAQAITGDRPSILAERAQMLIEAGRPEHALAALEREPGWKSDGRLRAYIVLALVRSGRFDEARSEYVRGSDTGLPPAYRLYVAAACRDSRAARSLWDESTKRNERLDPSAMTAYAEFLLRSGDLRSADEVLLRLRRDFPARIETCRLLTRLLTRKGDFTAAIRAGRRALLVAPGDAAARLDLAEALWYDGRIGEVMGVLSPALKSLSDGPERARTLAAYGTAALALGLTGEAQENLARGHAIAVSRAMTDLARSIAFNLALVARRQDEHARALELVEKYRLDDLDGRLIRVTSLFKTGQMKEALTLLELETKRSPVAALNYGILLRKAELTDDSLRVLQSLIDAWPQQALVHYHLGKSLEQKGRDEEARSEFLRASEMERDEALAGLYRKEAERLGKAYGRENE